jgi:hypothetical protein
LYNVLCSSQYYINDAGRRFHRLVHVYKRSDVIRQPEDAFVGIPIQFSSLSSPPSRNLRSQRNSILMHMDGWEDFLHFSFLGEHVLFEILPLNSITNFFWGSLLTILICLAERYFLLSNSRHARCNLITSQVTYVRNSEALGSFPFRAWFASPEGCLEGGFILAGDSVEIVRHVDA